MRYLYDMLSKDLMAHIYRQDCFVLSDKLRNETFYLFYLSKYVFI